MTTTSMIVMEPGGDWPGLIGDATCFVGFCKAGDEVVRKTQAHLAALRGSKQRVRVAVLACNAAIDSAATVRRAVVARMLLAAVADTTCGRLILTSTVGASNQVRQELLALTGALTEELRGTTVSILLRFNEAPPPRPNYAEKTRTAPTV